jgi:hypothetical protein
MGNPYPTYNGTLMKWTGGNSGDGNPVIPTTTFDGRYDMSRGGSITVTPGPRRFGGTFRLFYGSNARFYQYIYKFTPAIYKAYGDYICLDEGKFGCTPSTFVSDIGDTTAIYQATRFLLNVTGTGTGEQTRANTAKATTATGLGGYPTVNGQGTPNGAPASYVTGMWRYLNLIHPWTTGFAKVHNAKGSPNVITPQAQGYDIDLYGATKVTVTRYDWKQVWSPYYSSSSSYTTTDKQYLYGVGRIVSMVRPRLVHNYTVPLDPTADPITNIWQAARLHTMKVFFVSSGPNWCDDDDGVGCAIDNCQGIPNTGQDDTDLDNCGNICDADYDQSGIVGFPDFLQFATAYGTTGLAAEEKCHVEPIPGCTVDFSDFLFFAGAFGHAPGPSGTTAGTLACP